MDRDIIPLFDKALYTLANWDKIEKREIGLKLRIKIKIASLFFRKKRNYSICWRRGLLARAILKVDESSQGQEAVLNYFKSYLLKKGSVCELENLYNGDSLLTEYEITHEDCLLSIIKSYIDFIEKTPKSSDGCLPYFISKNEILVDGLMCCPFIFRVSKIFNNDSICNVGYNQILSYINNGLDENTSLPYHAYNPDSKIKLGIYGWGRGVGWFLTSIIDSIEYMKDEDSRKAIILAKYRSVIEEVFKYQNADGLFYWWLLATNGPVDTSATGMLLYSIMKGINLGLIPSIYYSRVKKGYNSLKTYVTPDGIGQAMADCAGIAMYPQNKYGAYPWSLGFYLLLTAEVNLYKNNIV